jgi:hypothetical protein
LAAVLSIFRRNFALLKENSKLPDWWSKLFSLFDVKGSGLSANYNKNFNNGWQFGVVTGLAGDVAP